MKHLLLRTSVCLVLTVLAGCVRSTRYDDLRRESASPASELAARSGDVLAPQESRARRSEERSVRLFEGKVELSLRDLLDKVLERNPSLAAMQSAWRAAVSRYPQVTALDDPMFSYSLAPGTIGSNDADFSQKIDLSQRFPCPGKLRLRGEAALSEAEASRSDLVTVRDRLLQETKRAFFDYYYVHRAIEINEVNLSLLTELQRIAETKYAAGTVQKQDALQAEVERYHLEHRAIVLERLRSSLELGSTRSFTGALRSRFPLHRRKPLSRRRVRRSPCSRHAR